MASYEGMFGEITKLCGCSLCNEALNLPKLLPCLHRFCKDCLHGLIEERHQDGFFMCPTCEEKYPVTEEGEERFDTDHYLELIMDEIRAQKQLLKDQTWSKCGACLNLGEMRSFCFSCKEPLCGHCCLSHEDHGSLGEEERVVIDLQDARSKGFSVEELLELPKAPKCSVHERQILRLVCFTCENARICNECVGEKHKMHRTGDLKTSAEGYFGMLEKKMETFCAYGRRLEKLQEKLENKVSYHERKGMEHLHTSYEENKSMIFTERSIIESEADLKMAQIEAKYDKEIEKQRQTMEEEIQKVKDRFGKIFDDLEKAKEEDLQDERKKKGGKIKKLQMKEEITEHNYQHLQRLSAALGAEEHEKMTNILIASRKMLERYKNASSIATRVLASRNDFDAVQTIPDIFSEIGKLTPDMNEITSLENVADEPICKYQLPGVCISAPGLGDEVERADKTITFRNSSVYGKDVDCITVNSGCNIVMSGHGFGNSHIFCMDINGNIINRKFFRSNGTQSISNRFCAALTGNKMATVCCPGEIGVFDLSDWSYNNKHLAKFTKWPESCNVRCVAADLTRNRIFVGSFNCRDVFIFDENLNYCETITLFPCTHWPFDMCVKGNQLLVCDHSAGKAFATDFKGKQAYKFSAPSHELATWKPRSICADKRGVVYVLWQTSDWSKAVVVQYRQENDGVMILRRVDEEAACITIMETDHETKLLLITKETGTLYVYSLVRH